MNSDGWAKYEEILIHHREYHRDRRNRFLHWVGTPLTYLGPLIPFGMFRFYGDGISLAMLIVLIVLVRFYWLQPTLGGVLTIPALLFVFLSEQIANVGFWNTIVWTALVSGVGFASVLIGHKLEGNRPAMVDRHAGYAFVGALILAAELAMLWGWNPKLKAKFDSLAVGREPSVSN